MTDLNPDALGNPFETDLIKPLQVGEVIGGLYEIRGALGEGAMCSVYEATDRILNRTVAIKSPVRRVYADHLFREAQALAAVRHPSLPVLFTTVEYDSVHLLVMERLVGPDLEEHLERRHAAGRPFRIAEGLELLIGVGEGLDAIHRAGIAHRDVKSANIMLPPNRPPVLLDLGLVTPEFASLNERATEGTPEYMAPEAIRGETAVGEGHLVDLYSFGVLAYEVLAGCMPYRAPELPAVLYLHLEGEVPDIRGVHPQVPARLADLIKALMSKRPSDRPQRTEEVLWGLRSVLGSLPPEQAEQALPSALIVDDDPDMRLFLREHLEEWVPQARVDMVGTAEAALECFMKHRPQLVVLDLQLPGMSGIELVMHFRGMQPRVQSAIVAISGTATPQDVQLLRELEVRSFLSKGPILGDMLEPIVRNVLLGHSSPGSLRPGPASGV